MTRLLAIDAVSDVKGVSVFEEGEELAHAFAREERRIRPRAERLLPLISDALKMSDTTLSEISTIAITVGPGSYTGIRVGVATVRGLLAGKNAKVVSVRTFELLEAAGWKRFGAGEDIVPVIQMRKTEWVVLETGETRSFGVDKWNDLSGKRIALMGDAPPEVDFEIYKHEGDLATELGAIASERAARGEVVGQRDLEPIYTTDYYS